jgi:hypothetical protein
MHRVFSSEINFLKKYLISAVLKVIYQCTELYVITVQSVYLAVLYLFSLNSFGIINIITPNQSHFHYSL